ncbi:MAG: trigger factor [Clostridiales bacterium]|nr:trigger factor [Clostridiales bacterium]
MALKSVSNPEKNVVELEITIDKPAFDEAVNKAYRKNVKTMNVPGFRKGKAPKSIIEKMYGKGVFYEDALQELIPPAYEEALKESKIDAVSAPEYDVDTIDDNGVVIKAKVFVRPEVELEDYSGFEVEREITPVKDEDIDREVERIRNRNSRTIDVTDRAAAMGDTVVIDYIGFDGEIPFEGGEAEDYSLKLGSNTFIPGFEEQIVGHVIDDEFDVNVTFPEEYHEESLKGKPVVFKVTLNAIKMTELPELDDEFAKDVSEFDTLDEYRADLGRKLEESNKNHADMHVETAIVDKLLEKMTVEVPEPMYAAEQENQLRDFDNRLRMQGMDLSTYLKYTGMDLDAMRKQFRPQAERQVKTRLALEKVAALENIEVSDEELEKEYEEIAKRYSVDLEQAKSIPSDTLKEDIRIRKALDAVKAKSVITDVEAKEDHDHGEGHDHDHEENHGSTEEAADNIEA